MPRLKLTRHEGEAVVIDGVTRVTLHWIGARRVELVFEAPDDVSIVRAELLEPAAGPAPRPPANPQLRRRR